MKSTREQLRWIMNRLEKFIVGKWPGLSCIAIIFDTAGTRERPTTVMLHGIDPEAAVRVLREHADMIEKAERGDNLIIQPGPVVIPPTRN